MSKFSLPFLSKRRSKPKGRTRSQKFSSVFLWITVLGAASVVILLGWQFVNRMWVKPPVSSTRERTDMLVKAGEHIQLTVMNGSGVPNTARVFTDFLRARQFDVVEMTNYKEKNVEHTFIIDKVSDTIAAQKVAYALGINNLRITHEPDSNAFVDAAIVIGKDYLTTSPMK